MAASDREGTAAGVSACRAAWRAARVYVEGWQLGGMGNRPAQQEACSHHAGRDGGQVRGGTISGDRDRDGAEDSRACDEAARR
ncbi:hypothetical protein FOTG_18115 [Fusarium oxysporum f. sp. vasinfectum 25433]|uniref:Uncharacterized protein n=1 Tax=Fusarium oxysporum f. sp. vasinfectum 25433 TaxID=1089449 RepID=X0KII3_FUSOX|nr:hypothetical protein FOTG_18115 [Fusarium oxysporum f. sp. vasinfectum 25433]